MKQEKYVQLYTGDGKGKTTAAFGLALRAAGRGFKVCIVQFFKPRKSGELYSIEPVENIQIYQTSTNSKFTRKMSPTEQAIQNMEITNGFKMLYYLMMANEYDLLVADELIHVLNKGNITQQQVEKLLNDRPKNLELVITGRDAPNWLIQRVDLVTEMKNIKHPIKDAGLKAREGIEY